jgi:hypothetical protein
MENEDCLERGEVPSIKPGHPDYISPREVERLLHDLKGWEGTLEDLRYKLHGEEKRLEMLGSGWLSTYILCLRIIFGAENTDEQLLRWRLGEYMKLGLEEKKGK